MLEPRRGQIQPSRALVSSREKGSGHPSASTRPLQHRMLRHRTGERESDGEEREKELVKEKER